MRTLSYVLLIFCALVVSSTGKLLTSRFQGQNGVVTHHAHAEEFLHKHLQYKVAHIWRPDLHGLQLKKTVQDDRGGIYYHYMQTYKGVPLYKSGLVMHVASDGGVRSVVGDVAHGDTDLADIMSPNEFLHTLGQNVSSLRTLSQPSLVITQLPASDTAVAAYTLGAVFSLPNGATFVGDVIASASNGEILELHSWKHTALDRTVYQFPDECYLDYMDFKEALSADPVLTEGTNNSDASIHAQEAYDNAGYVYWFYYHVFDRNSYNENGATLKSTIEALYPMDDECITGNAFWLGGSVETMVYLVDGEEYSNLEGTLDIVAHEFTHAVTDYDSDLVYCEESGAIDEGIADALGVSVKAWVASGGGESGSPASVVTDTSDTDQNTYYVGAAAVNNPAEPAIRYMNDPGRDGVSPDNYYDIYTCPNGCNQDCVSNYDSGYVHYNSGIFNMFFYLLAEGGDHHDWECGVAPLGIEKAYQIVYDANKHRLTPHTTFESLRYHLANSAADLFGTNSTEAQTVHSAMDCVRVPGSENGIPPDDSTASDDDEETVSFFGFILLVLMLSGIIYAVLFVMRRWQHGRGSGVARGFGAVGPGGYTQQLQPGMVVMQADGSLAQVVMLPPQGGGQPQLALVPMAPQGSMVPGQTNSMSTMGVMPAFPSAHQPAGQATPAGPGQATGQAEIPVGTYATLPPMAEPAPPSLAQTLPSSQQSQPDAASNNPSQVQV
eukprot:Rmarinus@m.18451